MAEAVVDQLELIEIEEQDRAQRAATLHPLERVLETVAEQHPVGQPGQRVVQSPMADLVLGRLPFECVRQHVGE